MVTKMEIKLMEIKFKKKYEEDTPWSVVLMDFLAILSKQYGYTIDEYFLQTMPERVKIDLLSPLVDAHNKAALELYTNYAHMYFHNSKIADKQRQQAIETHEVLNKHMQTRKK